MKKIINTLTLALLAALLIAGCKDSDSVTASRLDIFRGDDSTTISQMDFNIGAAFTMLGIDCDASWTASSDASWCILSNHAGYGYTDRRSYVKLSVEKNSGDARTATVTFQSGGTTRTLTINQRGAGSDPGDTFMTAYEFVENITIGYNLGNTLDADPEPGDWFNPTSDLDWETSWGQPVTTQEIIDSIHAKGFDVIRIPVTWFPHMDDDGNVSEMWMNRVEEVVGYVLNAGCYCILNVQHDTGERARGNVVDDWHHGGWLRADMDEYDVVSPRFKKLWQQIATRFRDYDEHLLFEAFNEILDRNNSWGDASDPAAYTAVSKLEQDFVDVVRATGGNNEFRNLVCNPYTAGNTQGKLDGFQPPQDVHANHILASIHSYDPYNFCNDNSGVDSNGNAYDYNIYVWDNACEQEVDALTARVNNRFNDLGIPYIYGEFGAIGTNKEMGERVKYARYMVAKFRAYDTKGLWWMGLINRKTLAWEESEIVDALISGTAR